MKMSRPLSGYSLPVPAAILKILIVLFGVNLAIAQNVPRVPKNPPVLPATDRTSRPVAPEYARSAAETGSAPSSLLNSSSWTALGPASLQSGEGLVSGRITGLAVDPTNSNTIYVAAAGGGVWKTTDGGTGWIPLTDSQTTLAMGSIAVAPSNPLKIYAGTGEANNSQDSDRGSGILVSNDGGATWTLATADGAFVGTAVGQIAVDPTDANIAYAAVGGYPENGVYYVNYGIWKTTDGGATWTNVTAADSLTTQSVWSSVVVDPNTPTIVYAAVGDFFNQFGENGIYRSVDGGATWSLLANAPGSGTANLGRIALAVSPAAKTAGSHVLYVAVAGDPYTTSGGLLYFGRSDNADATTPAFTDLAASTPDFLTGQGWYDIAVNVDSTGVVYCAGVENYSAGGADLIIQSKDLGADWTDISIENGFEPHTDSHALAFDSSNRVLMGSGGGVFRFDPVNPGWTSLNSNLNTIQFTGIGLHPTAIGTVVGGSQDNGTELESNDAVWTEVDGGDGGFAQFSQTDSSTCYAVHPIDSLQASSFFRVSNGGCASGTWNDDATGISQSTANFYPPFVVDSTDGHHVLLGTDYVNETTNGGSTWSPIGSPGSNSTFNAHDFAIDSVALSPAAGNNPEVVYASVGGDGAFVSQVFVANHISGSSTTWSEVGPAGCAVVETEGIGCRVNEIITDPNDPTGKTAVAVIGNFTVTGSEHVFRTANAGASWADITGNLPNLPIWSVQIDTDPSHTMYVSAEKGVYMSVSPYGIWTLVGAGLPNAQAVDLRLNSKLNALAVATHGRGAWEILTPAHIVSVSSVVANGAYVPGASIPIVVNFSVPVSVTGTPELTLNTTPNATVSYSSGSGTNALTFVYTVGTGQTTNGNATGGSLDYTSAGALSLNGGTIDDASGTPALLTLYAPGATGSLSANKQIVIAAKATPTVTVAPTSNSVTTVDVLSVKVTVGDGSGNPTPTGSIVLTGGGFTSAATVLSGGSATISVPAAMLAIGADTLQASYTPDTASVAIYTSSLGSSPTPITVSKGTPTVAVTPSSNSVTTTQSLSVAIAVTSGIGNPAPTGTVTLSGGGYSSMATALGGGNAGITIPAGKLSVGSYSLTAMYNPDSTSAAIYLGGTGTSANPVAVGKATPIVTVMPTSTTITTAQSFTLTIAVSGGPSSPTPTGSVVLSGGGFTSAVATLIAGSATVTIPAETLALGMDSFSAAYTPDTAGASIYLGATGTSATPVTVSKVTPTISLASSQNPSGQAQSVTFTATVSTPAGTPSGSVMFIDGTTTLGSSTLSSGTATYTTTALAVGTHSVTAQYSGDANYASVTSSPVTQTVSAFSIGPAPGAPTAVTGVPGSTAAYLLSVTPPGSSSVTFYVTGFPSGYSWSFSPNTISAGAGPTDLQLTIYIPAQSASSPAPAKPGSSSRLPIAFGLLLLPLFGLRKSARRAGMLALAASVLAGTAMLSGCMHHFNSSSNSNGSPTVPGSYNLTVTAIAGSQSQFTNVTLIVN